MTQLDVTAERYGPCPGMNKSSVSWQQGYDQGFSDALSGDDNAFSYAVTDGERDWMDGYYEGHTAGESALLKDS